MVLNQGFAVTAVICVRLKDAVEASFPDEIRARRQELQQELSQLDLSHGAGMVVDCAAAAIHLLTDYLSECRT